MTYAEYLELSALLQLQRPRSAGPAHDELLFIVIHQAYELWFKLVLHEADALRDALERGDGTAAAFRLRRLAAVQRLLNHQFDVLETMTPAGFAAFRDALGDASGFQSFQFREVEIALGKREPALLTGCPEPHRERLERRLAQPSVYTALLRHLSSEGYPVPEEAVEASLSGAGHPEARRVLGEIYQERRAGGGVSFSGALGLCEAFVDLDELFQEWRYRHVKLVERFIGARTGTGGSSGADYLRSTLFKPLYPDLWAVRG
jgi:tryptophan 2,3-dioxygenase